MNFTQARPRIFDLYQLLLRPERGVYCLIFIFGLAVSALTLTVPLSVQVLISTVANTAALQSVLTLAFILGLLLLLSGLFVAAQVYLMELFERRFFSRVVSSVTLRLLYAQHAHMERISRDELLNRYFDVMTVQKTLPALLTGGLALLLQTLVGVALTSLYHPIFLLFNLGVLTLAFLVYRLFNSGAQRTALALSGAKYACARWLEDLARGNGFFKSARTIDFALTRTLAVREHYLRAHRAHFHRTFAQIVGFLILYAVASATLLAVGGWLVIEGQLTVGQLVAAELILAAIFFALSRVGYYLELYYDLYAALAKLAQLFDLPVESPRRLAATAEWLPAVRFDAVRCVLHGGEFTLDLDLPAGSRSLIAVRSSSQIKAFAELLLCHRQPEAGRVLLGGHDIDDFDVHRLRDGVQVVDNCALPQCSVAGFLAIAAPDASRAAMRDMLDVVGLGTETRTLERGLDQELTPDGHPLSFAGVIKLKIAFALMSRPRLLVLTPLFDSVSHEARRSIIRYLEQCLGTTLVCFSGRHDIGGFDRYMLWDFDAQRSYQSIGELECAAQAIGSARVSTAGVAE